MMAQYVTLAQRIRQEIKDIQRVVTAAQRHWRGFQRVSALSSFDTQHLHHLARSEAHDPFN